MNGYVCFWNSKRVEVYASTMAEAKDKAIDEFKRIAGRKRVKPFDVTVVLAEKDGTTVTHSGSELP